MGEGQFRPLAHSPIRPFALSPIRWYKCAMQKSLIALFLVLLSACAADPNAVFIEGTWAAVVQETAPGPARLASEWYFGRGGFIFQQEIDTDTWFYSQGRYRVVSSEGDVLMVEVYDISGDRFTYNNQPATFTIEIDREAETIRINRREFEKAGN